MPAIFFDLVGTLVDEETDIEAHEHLMAELKKRFALEDKVADLLGEYHLLGADQFEGEAGLRSSAPSFTKIYAATFLAMMEKRGFRPSAEDEAWFHEAYFDSHRRKVKLCKDARKAVSDVRKLGVHVGLISDTDLAMVEEHLDFLNLRDAFHSVTSSETARALKPDARVFQFALRQSGCRPEEALMVGDSLERDVDGAVALGMKAILIDRHGARVTHAPKLRSLKGVPRLARKLLGL